MRAARSVLLIALLAGTSVAWAASAKEKKTPAAPPPQKPAVRVDRSPVSEGGKGGLVMSYADVLEPAQQAVVSVYSTKIIKERIAINPFFRQFFGNLPDQERESKQVHHVFKTPLWRSVLKLDTDGMLQPVPVQ